MHSPKLSSLLLFFLLLAVSKTTSALAAPPNPDFANVPGYAQALQQSTDPQAVVFLQEVAAGPAVLGKEQAAARAAGVSLEGPKPLPAPDANGAVAYQRLKALLVQKPLQMPIYAEPLSYGYVYTTAEEATVQQILDSRPDVFSALHAMAQMPVWVFPTDWSEGPTAQFPQVANLRACARDLDTESFLRTNQTQWNEAVQTQTLGLTLGKNVASTPLLINFLIGIAVDNITLSGFKSLLYAAGPNAELDAQIEKTIQANAFPLSLKAALSGQLRLELSELEQVRATTEATQTLNPDQKIFFQDLIAAAEARQIAVMLSAIAVADRSEPERRSMLETITQTDTAADNKADPVIALDDMTSFSNFVMLAKLDDKVHAQERVVLAAAAALANKARTGAFPAALPGNLLDPYSGKPLVYRREGITGFVVYSVGPEGTYDGSDPGRFQLIPANEFFRFPAPPPQPVTADMITPDN